VRHADVSSPRDLGALAGACPGSTLLEPDIDIIIGRKTVIVDINDYRGYARLSETHDAAKSVPPSLSAQRRGWIAAAKCVRAMIKRSGPAICNDRECGRTRLAARPQMMGALGDGYGPARRAA
jgi:hypothetical protein